MADAAALFQEAIAAAGMQPPAHLLADGRLHRFSPTGKHGESGWYVFHPDGVPAGAFGDWRGGLSQTWCAKPEGTMTPAEREMNRERLRAMHALREAEQIERQRRAAESAQSRWNSAHPVPQTEQSSSYSEQAAKVHPYLRAKAILAHGVRTEGDLLLVPMRDTNGTLHSLQTIAPDGSKRFLPGGRVHGSYFSIGKPNSVLVVCEGFGTGASIHEATGHAVAVAFSAGNLMPVAQALRSKYPELAIVLAADDDWKTPGNPGVNRAREAAQAVNGEVAVPVFPNGRPEKATDFNDLHRLVGMDAVKACFDVVTMPSPQEVVGDWPEPIPLPDSLPPVMPFNVDLLPAALRGWVTDIAHRMQCPPDFPAVVAMVALSSLIGARAVVSPKAKDDWRVVPNLWGMLIGRPGVMKSPALAQVLAPLRHLEAADRELWQAEHESWQLDCKVSAMAADANEKEARKLAAKNPGKARALLHPMGQPVEPIARSFIINDSTVEALADALTKNPWGLLVYRDELHGLLCDMDRQGQEGARSFYLTGYDGNQGYAIRRIGRGESYVPQVCLSLIGGIQPGKVQSYVRDAVGGGAGDDGLLQRFGLTVWPDVTQKFVYVDQWPDTASKQAASAVFERLAKLLPASDAEPVEWRFSADAQGLFVEWLVPFETELRGDGLHPALVSHLAKYRKLVPALALVIALVDTPDNGNVIGERELLRALAWADYLRSHAERLYAAAVTPETTGAKMLLDKITAGKLVSSDGVVLKSFSPREVAVKGWAGLTSSDAVRKAAQLLVEYGYLAPETKPAGASGGRPSERYLLHPILTGRRQ